MRQFPRFSVLAALLTAILLSLLTGCGGGASTKTPDVASIVITPTTISLNEGGVGTISAVARNSAGATIAADITFTSNNTSIATISSSGLVCGGVWDSAFVNCNATIGQGGVGQATITAQSGNATATATVYVHLQVDRVEVSTPNGCTTMGNQIQVTAVAFSTSAPGCSPTSPCDITSTVGPIAVNSNNLMVAANSSGIEPTFSADTNSPTYISGGTITGSKDQTCNLSNFTAGVSGGINPTYSSVTNSPTYTSGGTITGSAGQTCNLSDFNGVSGATATVTLTGTNIIAPGTPLIITAEGTGGITPPTTATLGNGTATCSGTATVITALNNSLGSGQSVIGAAATVALTGTNTIASGTHLTVTASGYGAMVPSTAATLSNGTATCSGTASVSTALTSSGVFTAENPGSTTIFGSVSGVNGVSVPYLTCPAAYILVHDASSSNTSFTLSKGGTQPLTADVFDTMGQYIRPSLTWASSSSAAASATTGTAGNNPGVLTALAPGTASITATCSPPDCNPSFPGASPQYAVTAQYSLNVVTATVSGGTTTNVYAASTNSTSLVPISTSTNTAGTAITLPYLPNSILSDPQGANLYLGSSSGLMIVNLTSNTVTTFTSVGKVVAISSNSNYLLLSDSTGNAVYYLSLGSTPTLLYVGGGFTTSSASYTPDSGYLDWVSGTDLAFGLQTGPFSTVTLPFNANALGTSAEGGLIYVTGSSPNEIDVRSTCNSSEVQALPANAPTLIQSIPNGTGAVATDSPGVDVISTPVPVSAGCPITTQSTMNFIDLGAGSYNARQMFFSSDSSHAWIISDIPGLLYLYLPTSNGGVIPYAGGVTAYSGGVTLDGSQIYVGASDGTVHRIQLSSVADVQQIAVNLKDANGNPVVPDLVTVQPH